MGAQVDLWQGVPGWEQLPEWIAAIATVFAFGAAVVAGVFAGKAAKHTADQAKSAKDQVRFADEQTALAKQQLDLARTEAREAREAALVLQAQAERAEQRLEQSRLDALMPVVHAAATLGGSAPDRPHRSGLEIRVPAQGQPDGFDWQTVGYEQRNPADASALLFRVNLTLTFQNISHVLARIDLPDADGGDFDRPVADGVVVPPGGSRTMIWSRTLLSTELATDELVHAPERRLFRMDFWVRDLGLNVRDIYAFSADVAMFSRDGADLVFRPNPSSPWTEAVAWPWPERAYGREAATAPTTAPPV